MVAFFLFAATAIAVTVAVSLLVPGALSDRLWELNRPAEAAFRRLGWIASLLLLLLATGTLAAGLGLRNRRRWAWWFAVALFAVNAAGDVAGLLATGDWVRGVAGIVVGGAFLVCLLRRRVRRYLNV